MYNPYLPSPPPEPEETPEAGGPAGLWKRLGLEELDTGDALLLLILLFLFLDGKEDNLELLITLGLLLLL